MATKVIKSLECRYGIFNIFDEEDLISKSLNLYGEWAQGEIELFSTLISEGDVVIDVGAYIGTHTRAFSSFVGASGKVYAFEPYQESFNLLSENAALSKFQNIKVLQLGLGSVKEHRAVISIEKDNKGSTRLEKTQEGGGQFSQQVDSLDSFDLEKVSLLKIDVEGMEFEVLKGAQKTIKKNHPLIFLEVNTLNAVMKIFDWAILHKYRIYGVIASAFNPENFRRESYNLFDKAQECGILLVPNKRKEISHSMSVSNLIRLSEISTIDDLAVLMLHKPQYVSDILQKSSLINWEGQENAVPMINHEESVFKSKYLQFSYNPFLVDLSKLQEQLEITEQAKNKAEDLAFERLNEIENISIVLKQTQRAKEAAETLAIKRQDELENLNKRLEETESAKGFAEELLINQQKDMKAIESAKSFAEDLAIERQKEIETLYNQLQATENAKFIAEKLAFERHAKIDNLSSQLELTQKAKDNAETLALEREKQLILLEKEKADLEKITLEKEREIKILSTQVHELEFKKSSTEKLILEKQSQIENLTNRLIVTEQEKKKIETEARILSEEIEVIHSSKLWRLIQKLQ